MPESKLTKGLFFNEDLWVVSLITTSVRASNGFTGHSALMVEGVRSSRDSRLFSSEQLIGFYDIQADLLGGSRSHGVIGEVRIEETEDYTKEDYTIYKPRSARAPAKLVEQMIQSIKNDQERIKHGEQIKFSIWGNCSILGKLGEGINCTNWCCKKLEIAGIGNGYGKKPKKPSCIIL